MNHRRHLGPTRRVQTRMHIEYHVEPGRIGGIAGLELVADDLVDQQGGGAHARGPRFARVVRHQSCALDQLPCPLRLPRVQLPDRLLEQVLRAGNLGMAQLVEDAS